MSGRKKLTDDPP